MISFKQLKTNHMFVNSEEFHVKFSTEMLNKNDIQLKYEFVEIALVATKS